MPRVWSREGNNLLYKQEITLSEALCTEKIVDVETFDGRIISHRLTEIISPGYSFTVPGEGICGADLIICFDIKFPMTLTPAAKMTLKKTLP